MTNFIYSTPQTNLIVIKLLHHSALKTQAEYNHQFVVVIEIGAVPRTFSVLDTECRQLLFSRKKYPLITQKLLY